MIEHRNSSRLFGVDSAGIPLMFLLQKSFCISFLLFVFCNVLAAQTVPSQSKANVDYLTEIKPLLREKCCSCHGALKQEGGLRLDAASLILKGGDSGPSYVAGTAENSLILERVHDADDSRMPPPDDGTPLTEEEIKKLTAWIEAGAKAPEEAIPEHPSQHWSFLSPVKSDVPAVSAKWIRSDIDRFLGSEHRRVGVDAVGEASRSMLLRRVSLALTGLPPTLEERRVFLKDETEAAFENAVDRLLKSPRYGERWARHFMDIWRYSDPSGFGKEIRDGREHIWRWRDWIVESLNEDKSYDQMIVELLAADEFSPEDQSSLRATGYLARNWYKFSRDVWLDNIVEHSSKAFLGLTVNCARCHDHKYDPFEQTGYYQMRAIFESHDVRDDPVQNPAAGAVNGMLVRAYDAHLDRKTFNFLLGDADRPEKDPLPPGLPKLLGELSIEPVPLPVTVWYPALRKENRDAALKVARAKIEAADTGIVNARAAVVAAQKKLADFQEPKVKVPKAKTSKPKQAAENAILSEDFSTLDLERWRIEGGKWAVKNGRVIQSDGATVQHRLVSSIDHPRDFRAKLKLRITGGETYQSVGFGFDGQGKAMNSVYLSVSGSKVQFSSQGNNGRWQYPASGMTTHSVKIGQDYLLELVVKDQLLNVLIDGELKVAYDLPKRKAGRMSVWAFSATAEFDQIDVTMLPPNKQLVPVTVLAKSGKSAPPKLLTKKDLQLALKVAEAAEKVAIAQRLIAQSHARAMEARTIAETVKYGLAPGDVNSLAKAAGRASRQHAVNQLSEQIAQSELKIEQARLKQEAGDSDLRTKAVGELKAAEKQLTDLKKKFDVAKGTLDNGSTQYAAIGTMYPKTSSGRRLAFARWITDRKNPLAARVLVNHVWLRHFGAPLVERTFDFGLRSEKPRLSKLLDWLAVQFMEDGWSLKKLHKRIVMSGVYRRSSSPAGASAATQSVDPDNLTFWRMNARRMEAEVARDSVLSIGNSLDLKMGGPPIEHTQGQAVLRRSLYFRQDKERQMTFLSLFDGAKVNECYERKPTVAPQQALAMFNSRISAEQAQKVAESHATLDGSEFVTKLFEHVLCREPTSQELAECLQFLAEFRGSAEARRQLALVILNHNDFITIR